MATTHHTFSFDRPLAAVQLARDAAPVHTSAELAAARASGHLEATDAGRMDSERQVTALRLEFQQLQSGLFHRLAEAEESLAAQVRAALPALTVELGRRLLADFVPPPDLVEKLCREALDQLHPERDGLELVVSARDASILERIAPSWSVHFTNLRITIDDTLNLGDCLVRSRFGVTDARASAKIEGLRHELLSA